MAQVGRPRKFKTQVSMQKAIDTYFAKCRPTVITDKNGKAVTDKNGRPVMTLNPPTISGLALHLGFVNRQSMYDYENRGEFSDTIKTARLRCENWVEIAGLEGNTPPAMAIFALKNYGWTDKSEVELNTDSAILNAIKDLK